MTKSSAKKFNLTKDFEICRFAAQKIGISLTYSTRIRSHNYFLSSVSHSFKQYYKYNFYICVLKALKIDPEYDEISEPVPHSNPTIN
jgi:hypothetical protein